MSQELDPTDFEAVISHYNIGSLDRQQEIWDRAMPKEMTDHMFATFVHNAGLGPHPGKYNGPVPDFEAAGSYALILPPVYRIPAVSLLSAKLFPGFDPLKPQ